MGGKGKRRKNSRTKTQNEESNGQNLEGKCCHVQEGVKFSNISNVIPHADLTDCQECSKLLDKSKNDQAIEPLETKDDSETASSVTILENSSNIKETEVSVKISQECDSHGEDLNSTSKEATTEKKSLTDGNDSEMSPSTTDEEKPGLCVCLRCGFIACSRQSSNQHALEHYNAKNSHPVVLNLSNWVIWCYKCDDQLDNEQLNAEAKQCLSLLTKALGKKMSKHADKQKFSIKKDVSSNIYSASEGSIIKGLTNLGNTCFFNSVMQNLCQTRLLRLALEHLLLGNFEYNVDPSPKNKTVEPLTVLITGKNGPLTLALVKFLQDMASDSKKHIVNPGNIFAEICKKAPRFKGFRQQDSQELLRYLLDSVRTEEIKGVKRGILGKFDLKPGATEDDIAKKAASEDHEKIRLYGRYAGAPVVDTLFGGQLVSSVECLNCHKVSSITESFFDLSLSLATNKPSLPCDQYSKKKQQQANVSGKNRDKRTTHEVKSSTVHEPSKHCDQYSKKKQQAVNVGGKNRDKKTNHEVKSSTVHEPSKHQKKKKAKEAKKEKKKQRRHSSNMSKNESKLSENNEDEQEEDTVMNGSDVEKLPGNDVEVPEKAMNNLTLDENDVTGLNVEENSCEEKYSLPSSCKDVRDTSGTANESRKDISDVEGSREPNDIQELRDMRTGEEENMVYSNESPEDEKVVEMNSVETSENIEDREEPRMKNDAGSAVSDNVKLCKSPVQFPGSIQSEMKTENMVPLGEVEDGVQRDRAMDYEATNKEIQLDTTGNDEKKSEEKERKNTRLCSDDAKDSKNEGTTTFHESNLQNVHNTQSDDCAEIQGNAAKESDIESVNKSNSVFSRPEVIAPNDVVSCENGALNHLKPAFKNASDVFQPINELNPTVDEVCSLNDIKTAADTTNNSDNIDSVVNPSNALNPEINDEVNSDFVSCLNDLKHTGVNVDNDNQTTVQDNEIDSTNSSDNISRLHPSICAPKNEFNSTTNDVSSDVIASCRPLELPVQDVSENNSADPSNEVEVLESSVQNASENNSAGPSNEVEVLESSVQNASENQSAGPSNEVEVLESSVENVSENQSAGPSNEVEPVINGSISDPVNIPDPSDKNNANTDTLMSSKLECEPSSPQDPPNCDNKTAQQADDTNEEPSEGDGCFNELQEGHSRGGTEDCLNGGAETERSPFVASEILSGRHSLGDIGPFHPNTMSVENCLNKFCTPEKLDGNNKFICEECNKRKTTSEDEDEESTDDNSAEENDASPSSKKKKSETQLVFTEAVKQMLIYQPPPILTLHLKRFHQVGFALKKLAKHVQFPLILDLSPFCHKSSKVATDSEGKVLYSLCGLVEHSGSLHSGHYTAYCHLSKPSSLVQAKFESLTQLLEAIQHMWTQNEARAKPWEHEQPRKGRWFHISDSHVSEVSEQSVLQAQAYLLFYERMVLHIENTETE